MSTNSIPVGSAVLGRVLNANGEPIDHKGSLDDAMHLPLYVLGALSARAGTTSMRALETGIKVLDLMAPASYGSIIGMIAGSGLGLAVVTEEIMHTLVTRHQAVLVVAGMSETTYDASTLREMVRDIEAEDCIVMLFEQTTDAIPVRQRLLRTAMTIAAHFDGAGHEVLLVMDRHLVIPENMADVHLFAAAKGITSLLLVPMNDRDQPANSRLLNELDVQWWFSRARAKQSLWPAIDPLASHSRVLESNAVSQEHRQVAERVRDVLLRYHELRKQAGSDTLSEEDRRLLARGERIDLFLTQPFVVAEAYTDLPGAYLTIEETISSFRDLLDGRYDAVPAQSFNFVGRIDQG
jgi:F-type H+/Na+-transporting ATPase subunit beta